MSYINLKNKKIKKFKKVIYKIKNLLYNINIVNKKYIYKGDKIMEKLIREKLMENLKSRGIELNGRDFNEEIKEIAEVYSQPEIINEFGEEEAAEMAAYEIYMEL